MMIKRLSQSEGSFLQASYAIPDVYAVVWTLIRYGMRGAEDVDLMVRSVGSTGAECVCLCCSGGGTSGGER